ncbi:MAG TPA: response regulator [Desulfotignum sp.]|nr:response regulator [Desulfotignum sp.]
MKIQLQRIYFNLCVLLLALAVSGMVLSVNPFSFGVFTASLVVFCICMVLVVFTRNQDKAVLDQVQKALHREKTQRKKAENDLVKVSENADQAMKIKDEFLANMSHEIRNPMNGIIGMMHVLKDSDLDEDQRKYADIVYNSAQALLVIVNDILDLSKIEAGKLELDVRPFDLEIGIRDMVSLPELQARQKGIDFSCYIDPQVPRLLKGDIGRLRQVILNLIGNAVKFTESGNVSFAVTLNFDEDTKAGLHFSIEDTGVGIKDGKIDHIFESFNQADISTTKRFGGTGLGLSISRLLVEKMGGRMGVESFEMVGSTFWFDLAFEKALCQEMWEGPRDLSVPDCRLLLVSETPGPSQQLAGLISTLGTAHETALDGKDAFDRLVSAEKQHHPFDVVLMEVQETGRYARKLGAQICHEKMLAGLKLVIVTGVGQKGEAREFEKIGFAAFLSKPVDQELLTDCIKTVLAMPPINQKDRPPIITRYSIEENKKQSHRILVVEDIETNRITARTLISRLGYAIDEAEDGKQAVKKHGRLPYDLILMDCQMPVMDGYAATREIRSEETLQKQGRTPIIAMTGNAFARDREKCFAAGMDDFITKPVQPDILAQKIWMHLFAKPDADPDTRAEQVSAPPVESSMRFNKEQLWERFGHDKDMIQEILTAFFQETPGLLKDLAHAVENKDVQAVAACAHALKGSAANVNADRLKNLVLGLEQNTRKNEVLQFEEIYDKIQTEYELFAGELAR